MIGDRDTGVAGEKGFVGCKDTHHHRQQQEQLGGGREGLPPGRSSPLPSNKPWGGQGSLFVPVDSRPNKAFTSIIFMLICFAEIGVLRGN